MRYRFKAAEELAWAVAIAVALVVLPALMTLEPEKVTDWHVWAVALAGASLRAAAGAALDFVRRAAGDDLDDLADRIAAMPLSERARLLEELEERRLGAPHG